MVRNRWPFAVGAVLGLTFAACGRPVTCARSGDSAAASGCNPVAITPRVDTLVASDTVQFPAGAQRATPPNSVAVAPVGAAFEPGTLSSAAIGSDLWPMTWADDGNQYTAWGDGFGFAGGTTKWSYGISRISGGPVGYTATDVLHGPEGINHGKIASMISVNGVLYLWMNTQDGLDPPTHRLYKSTNHGASITRVSGIKFPVAAAPELVNLGFVQMGQDNRAAIDSYVYLTATNWQGSPGTSLLRVPVGRIEDQAAYEVFSGNANAPTWSSDLTKRAGLETVGAASYDGITYNAALRGFVGLGGSPFVASVTVWFAPKPWGPWGRVADLWDPFGLNGAANPVSLGIAPKWLSADGREFWIVFSGTGSWDRLALAKGLLQLSGDPPPAIKFPTGPRN